MDIVEGLLNMKTFTVARLVKDKIGIHVYTSDDYIELLMKLRKLNVRLHYGYRSTYSRHHRHTCIILENYEDETVITRSCSESYAKIKKYYTVYEYKDISIV